MKLTHCILLSAMLSAPVVRAEETVQWADLPKIVEKAQRGGSREFTVVTKAGEKKRNRRLTISTSGLQLEPDWPRVPRDQVSEIRVGHRGRLSYFGWVYGKLCKDEFSCIFPPTILLILPLDLAAGVVATPPMLVIEGVRRLMPTRTIKIAP